MSASPIPDIGLSWGLPPTTTEPSNECDCEDIYTESEKAKMHAKGINPALKAEMDTKRKEGGKKKEVWGRVAQTALGGWVD